jgi:hypothetical protein
MTEHAPEAAPHPTGEPGDPQTVIVIGPDGQPVAAQLRAGGAEESAASSGAHGGDITDLVEQPAKVMRIGSMIRQLLEEVKSAPLDEASRTRLREIHQASIKELETGLAPELIEELERITLPFTDDSVPSESELRIAQAQLVGWLEGVFHGIQTAIYAQQMAARAQLEQMRRSLPPGANPTQMMPPGPQGQGGDSESGGMYL